MTCMRRFDADDVGDMALSENGDPAIPLQFHKLPNSSLPILINLAFLCHPHLRSRLNQIRRFLRNRIHSLLQMCTHNQGNNRRIDNTQLLRAINQQLRTNNTSHFQWQHRTTSTRMRETRLQYSSRIERSQDLGICLRRRAWQQFDGREHGHGFCREERTRVPDSGENDGAVDGVG